MNFESIESLDMEGLGVLNYYVIVKFKYPLKAYQSIRIVGCQVQVKSFKDNLMNVFFILPVKILKQVNVMMKFNEKGTL